MLNDNTLVQASFLPKNDVDSLTRFVFEQVPAAAEKTYIIVDNTLGKKMRGYTWRLQDLPGGYGLPEGKEFFVNVQAGESIRYPRDSTYRKRAGSARFLSWAEEYVLTLAHEMAHVAQWLELEGFGAAQYEVEAEKFGMDVLAKFRASGLYEAVQHDLDAEPVSDAA